jgi:hypothetical protein
MKSHLWLSATLLSGLSLLASGGWAQPPDATAAGKTLAIRGDRKLAEAEQLHAIWLYPEDYLGKTLTLEGFIFEPENFEFHASLNGYLFACEPVLYARNNAFHAHVGNPTFLSPEKLNFFCSTTEGRRIRELFKQHQGEVAMPARVVVEIRQRDGVYFADLISYTPRRELP